MEKYYRETIKIYARAAKKHWLTGFFVMFGATCAYIINSIIPLYFKKFFDLLSVGTYDQLFGVLMLVLMWESIRWVAWRLSTFPWNYFESSVYKDLQNYCFQYLHKHSFAFFGDNFSGSLTKKVINFPKAFVRIFDAFVFEIWGAGINVIIILAVLSLKNIYLGLGLLVWVVLFSFINIKFSKFKFKYDRQHNEAESVVSGDLADTIINHSNVKLFSGRAKEDKIYQNLTGQAQALYKKTLTIEAIFNAVQGLFAIVLEIGIFYFALRLWRVGQFGVGDFVLLQSYALIVLRHVWSLASTMRNIYRGLSDADEMTEILLTPHDLVDVKQAKTLKVEQGLIEYQDVNFNYKQTRQVLKDFNLTIPAKQKIALIGPSGAGKTTVVKLLLRNFDIDQGKILIDGQKINQVTQESLWSNISLVPQDPILFHRSIRDNIAYGSNRQVTSEEIIKAAKLANCHKFIMGLPEQYETFVGERGVKLSGGERQRVAIARAILRNAPILVLDEATSSLDSESERLIQEALDNLMKNKTVIVIAHRLSTIKKMDRIVVVDKGQVLEDGTHQQLIKKSHGLYKKLWNLQVEGFEQ